MTIRDANIIDLVTEHPSLGYACLIIIQEEEWSDYERDARELQDKINLYLSYALDGQLARDYPDLLGKRIRIQLDCLTPPPRYVRELASKFEEACKPYDVEFIVNELQR